MEQTTRKLTFGNCPVDVDKYQEIKEELLKFGLTSNQVKVFFYLGKFGSKTAIEISKNLVMPRTETYHLLSALQSKGIVSASFNHPTQFSAISLDQAIVALINAESERLNSLKNSKSILTKLWDTIPDVSPGMDDIKEEKFQVIKGGNQVNSKITDMISRTEGEFLILGCEKDFMKFYHSNFLEIFENNSINFKFLSSTSEKGWYIFDELDKSKVKRLSSSVKDNLCFLIRDHEEILIFVKNSRIDSKDTTALWTNSESIIYSNILLFKNLWSHQSETPVTQKITK